jgi:hypothetical protein
MWRLSIDLVLENRASRRRRRRRRRRRKRSRLLVLRPIPRLSLSLNELARPFYSRFAYYAHALFVEQVPPPLLARASATTRVRNLVDAQMASSTANTTVETRQHVVISGTPSRTSRFRPGY